MSSQEAAGEVAAVISRWSEAAQRYFDGDLRAYADLAMHAEGFTLLPPFGGDVRRGFDGSEEAADWTRRYFNGGEVHLDVLQTFSSADLMVLVAVERQHGTVGDFPPQDWSLRITLVFHREGADWRLVHRHADPLVRPVNADLIAAIARGDHASTD